jgi:hypothetical protein
MHAYGYIKDKVEDPRLLEGVNDGDKVDVTYTAAVTITVK